MYEGDKRGEPDGVRRRLHILPQTHTRRRYIQHPDSRILVDASVLQWGQIKTTKHYLSKKVYEVYVDATVLLEGADQNTQTINTSSNCFELEKLVLL